ncbi:MAG: aminodeoxychorismate/anthranilate synthase component II [Bacteroidia bacterium]|nr:aminodeoxychorismate/anthranilate synthase component II [Bacteroidia bacterium]
MKILLIDNYDSFTHILADYIRQCGATCTVVRNDEEKILNTNYISDFNCIVLSPGPETPSKAGFMMQVLNKFYNQIPILGVCLGHQAIGEFFGAKLIKAQKPMHGKVDTVYIKKNHPIFENIEESFTITRYHSLILTELKQPLSALALSRNNEIMIIAHSHLPIVGIQFHPESYLTDYGLVLIKNFITFAAKHLT